MDRSGMNPMVGELVKCFVPPTASMIEKMNSVADSIPEDARADVLDAIIEAEAPSSKIGVKQIVEACQRLGVSYHRAMFVPAQAWVCDACGRTYQYTPAPTDDDKIDKGLSDVCPDCGCQAYWTILRDRQRLRDLDTSWYDRAIAECQDWGPNKPTITVKKGNLTLTRGGVFWSRARAESERREDKRLQVNARLAEIDRAKRVEISKPAVKPEPVAQRLPYADSEDQIF